MTFAHSSNATLTDPSAPTEVAPSVRGRRCGRYLLLDVIGEGGNGVVYRAYDPELNRQLAIKLLHTPSDVGSRGAERVMREARAIAQLAHRHVIAIYDVGEHEGEVFIGMELASGGSLRDWLRSGTRPVAQVLTAFREAGEGLKAAHRAGLVHRDFKPGNVLFAADGTVKVADFGLARTFGDADELPSGEDVRSGPSPSDTLTATGALVGTPAYMAPEQLARGRVDARADQYAYCVSLYEALVGERPRREADGSVAASIARVPVSRRVRQVLARGLATRPEDRFDSMDALLSSLGSAGRVPRWSWLLLAAVVAMGGVAVMGTSWPEVCGGADSEWEAVWNASVADDLRAAFVATGKGNAAETFERFDAAIRSYGRTWRDARTRTCRETFVEQTVSGQTFDLRQECLERRLAQVVVLTEVWSDPEQLDRAASGALGMAPGDECLIDAELEELRQLPTAPAERAVAEHLSAEADRVQALTRAGRYDDAWKLTQEVESSAPNVGLERQRAQLRFLATRLERFRGHYDEALAFADEAVELAAMAGDDEVEANAWLEKQFIYFENKRENVPTAVVHATRLAVLRADEPRTRATYHDHQGMIARFAGDYAEAEAQHRRAAEILRDAFGDDDPVLAFVYNNLGLVQYDSGRFDEARATHRKALAIKLRRLGESHASVANTQYNIGLTFAKQGQWDGARESFEAAIAIRESSLGPDHPLVAYALVELGKTLENLGETQRALEALHRALAIRRRALGPRDGTVAPTCWRLGMISLNADLVDEAAEAFECALSVRNEIWGPDHYQVGNDLFLLGLARERQGRGAEARRLFEESLDILERDEEQPDSWLGEARFALARLLWEQPRDRPRALRLAGEAEAYFSAREGYAAELAEVRGWRAERR